MEVNTLVELFIGAAIGTIIVFNAGMGIISRNPKCIVSHCMIILLCIAILTII